MPESLTAIATIVCLLCLILLILAFSAPAVGLFMDILFRLGYSLDAQRTTASLLAMLIGWLRRVLKVGGAELAGHLANLAMLYNAAGIYEKAEPLYKEALLLFREAIDNNPENCRQLIEPLTIVCEDYASLLEITNRSSEAAVLLTEAANGLAEQSYATQAETLRQRAAKISS